MLTEMIRKARKLLLRVDQTEPKRSAKEHVEVYEWTIEHTNGDVETYVGHRKEIDGAFFKIQTYEEVYLEALALMEEIGVSSLHKYDRFSTERIRDDSCIIDSVKEVRSRKLLGYDTVTVIYNVLDYEITNSHIEYAEPHRRQ